MAKHVTTDPHRAMKCATAVGPARNHAPAVRCSGHNDPCSDAMCKATTQSPPGPTPPKFTAAACTAAGIDRANLHACDDTAYRLTVPRRAVPYGSTYRYMFCIMHTLTAYKYVLHESPDNYTGTRMADVGCRLKHYDLIPWRPSLDASWSHARVRGSRVATSRGARSAQRGDRSMIAQDEPSTHRRTTALVGQQGVLRDLYATASKSSSCASL